MYGGTRMKNELNCNIVHDLLPNYIEKRTSDATNHMMEQHLDTCEDCKKVYEQMTADISNPKKVPVFVLKFLKKVNCRRLLAAALCIVLTLELSYLIYTSEYKYTYDKNNLATAITEFTTPFEPTFDAYVLETKAVEGELIVSFKNESYEGEYGIAKFLKGVNQRYRIVSTEIDTSNYSSVVEFFPLEIKEKRYIAVSGYNLSNEIMYYGLDYDAYTNPDYLEKDRVSIPLKFEVKNPQFLEIYSADELDTQIVNTSDKTLYNYHLMETSLYDAEGMEITENYRNIEVVDNMSPGAGKAELFVLYIIIALVLGLGFLVTRYILTE